MKKIPMINRIKIIFVLLFTGYLPNEFWSELRRSYQISNAWLDYESNANIVRKHISNWFNQLYRSFLN